jgi:hypothetical protein
MITFNLNKEEFKKLLRLCRLYRREAEKCMEARSYLAGCVMVGAALEADLILMCDCYSDEIPVGLIPKGRNGKCKHLSDWSLFQLLRVARECNWLPSGLTLGDRWNQKKAEVGDYAVVVKETRNLVHAGRYIKDFPKSRLTKRRMEMCFEILEAASDHLLAKLHTSLKAAMEKGEYAEPNKKPNRRETE